MSGEIVYTIGGVGLTQPQIDLLSRRQITLSMLENAAITSEGDAMKLYIRELLDSRGGHNDAAGPGIDYNFGNSN